MSEKKYVSGVIERLKEKLGFRFKNQLSKKLGKGSRYISVIKSRGVIGGDVWNDIFDIAKENDIDLNYLIYGKHKGQSEDEILTRIERKVDRLLDNQ